MLQMNLSWLKLDKQVDETNFHSTNQEIGRKKW